MAGTATPPAAPPAAPQTPPPATPPAPPQTPQGAPSPDADPNLAMDKMVAKSRSRTEKPADPAPPTTPTTPAAPPAEPPKPPGSAAPNLTNLLGKALRFTDKPGEPPPAAPATPPPATPPGTPPADPQPPAGKKTPTKKKTAAPVIDTAAIVRDAAAATATAVATALKPAPAADPADELTESDRRDYEIAQHLSKMDARFKDAPKLILDHVRKADEYAANWERANPGKVFDPNGEEHNDFYDQLQRPWTPEQFQDAAIDLRAEQKAAKMRGEHDRELGDVKRDQAVVELAPVVDREFTKSIDVLADLVGPDIKKTLHKGGWEELDKEDPVAAQVLSTTLAQLHPFIEAAIQIDDVKQRVPIDNNNPFHQQWNRVVSVGEANLAGQELEGRMFATRADYVKMTPAQQARHWYLTTEMIIQGALDYAGKEAKRLTEEGKARLDKMGYKRATAAPPAPPATPPAVTPPTQPPAAPPATPPASGADKPISPSTSSGSKIDQPPDPPKTAQGALIGEISRILFRK